MMLKKLELHGFKSFAKKTELFFDQPVTAIVGPNGSGKSNIVESIRFVLGEQSSKSLRSASGKDLIFAGSQHIPKMNRARVSLTFDNSTRVFTLSNAKNQDVNVDFDEITLSRTVFTDGSNTYQINGHDVRMKDIVELIASVNIGSSGHHIISQGEADRLLNASAKERKSMIEDALGLKLYQYRIKETQKKLEKTHTHLHEVQSLRRELAPHLKFLERQVAKIEKARELRTMLTKKYSVYLSRESALLESERGECLEQLEKLHKQRGDLSARVESLRPKERDTSSDQSALHALEASLRTISQEKSEIERTLGKLEGMIEIAQAPQQSVASSKKRTRIYFDDVAVFLKDIMKRLSDQEQYNDASEIHIALRSISERLGSFIDAHQDADVPADDSVSSEKLASLKESHNEAREALTACIAREQGIEENIHSERERIQNQQEQQRLDQKLFFETQSQLQEVQSQLRIVEMEHERIEKNTRAFAEEITEGQALIGESILEYKDREIDNEIRGTLNRDDQESLRKELERMKIKLEEMGGGSGSDVITEFEETKERDAFLEREMADIEQAVEKLESLIDELHTQLEREFTAGIDNINEQFNLFFGRMFGGGKARLKIVAVASRKKSDDAMDEDDTDMGIEILVNLPRKKITHLEMLSGGERSLTSIALLFALSQVNPPPFLVLDETDAALDEANSRRYGDMIESLSEYSQLMVVTHNRETMSRADALYGVTIGSEECSQLLSVRFEQAEEFAK